MQMLLINTLYTLATVLLMFLNHLRYDSTNKITFHKNCNIFTVTYTKLKEGRLLRSTKCSKQAERQKDPNYERLGFKIDLEIIDV